MNADSKKMHINPSRVLGETDPLPAGKYVYQIEVAAPNGWVPIYVGVGTGARVRTHFAMARGTRRFERANRRFISTLRDALTADGGARVLILAEGLSKHQADAAEIEAIKTVGRVINGTGRLLNTLAGGASPDPESCRLMRARIPPEERAAAARQAAARYRWRLAGAKAAAAKSPGERAAAARKAAETRKRKLAEAAAAGGSPGVPRTLTPAQKAARTRSRRLAALQAAKTRRERAAEMVGGAKATG